MIINRSYELIGLRCRYEVLGAGEADQTAELKLGRTRDAAPALVMVIAEMLEFERRSANVINVVAADVVPADARRGGEGNEGSLMGVDAVAPVLDVGGAIRLKCSTASAIPVGDEEFKNGDIS